MFEIYFCDVQMKSKYYLKFSTNVFIVESCLSSSSSFNYVILVLFCLPLVKLSQHKKHVGQISYFSS